MTVGKIMPSPDPTTDIHMLIPGSWEYVTLQRERDFADVIKLRIVRWGRLSWIIWVPQDNYKSPHDRVRERFKDVAILALRRRKGPLVKKCDFKQVASRSWQRQENEIFPGPPEGMKACWHFDFSPVKCITDLRPPEHQIITSGCFKPWSLQLSVISAIITHMSTYDPAIPFLVIYPRGRKLAHLYINVFKSFKILELPHLISVTHNKHLLNAYYTPDPAC